MGKTVEETEREEMPSGVVGLRNLGKRTADAMSAMCLCLPNALDTADAASAAAAQP